MKLNVFALKLKLNVCARKRKPLMKRKGLINWRGSKRKKIKQLHWPS